MKICKVAADIPGRRMSSMGVSRITPVREEAEFKLWCTEPREVNQANGNRVVGKGQGTAESFKWKEQLCSGPMAGGCKVWPRTAVGLCSPARQLELVIFFAIKSTSALANQNTWREEHGSIHLNAWTWLSGVLHSRGKTLPWFPLASLALNWNEFLGATKIQYIFSFLFTYV